MSMDGKTVRGAFLGVGALLAVLIIGLFVFNYFNQRVMVIDNSVSVVTVMSKDGTTDLGIVYVDTGELVSTVEDADFNTYFDTNKKTLLNGIYKYTASILQDNGSMKDQEVETDKSLEDFADGLIIKLQTDLGEKYSFRVDEMINTL
jgi:hypothetical protein